MKEETKGEGKDFANHIIRDTDRITKNAAFGGLKPNKKGRRKDQRKRKEREKKTEMSGGKKHTRQAK